MGKQVTVRTAAELGIAVAEARRRCGLSQVELAEQTGIARTYLARMETGLTVVLLDRVLLVLRRLGAQMVVTLPDPDQTPSAASSAAAQSP
ncbi:MAG: helix-turn-helix transcriptional regulator [Mycobacteriales bacterium]